MSSPNAGDELVRQYLRRVEQALSGLSAPRRHQILSEIQEHIAEGRSALAFGDMAGLRALLDRVGDPEDIAQAAGVESPKTHWSDALVPWLLLLGGFLFVFGWIVGVALLWSSRTWRSRDRWLGTLIWPGGLFAPIYLASIPGGSQVCTGSRCVTTGFILPAAVGVPLLLLTVLAPVVVAIHLDRVRRHPSAEPGDVV